MRKSSACDLLPQPAEQRLKTSEIRYRRLFEAAQDGILILNADTGEIDDVNPYLTNMLGYSRAQLLGKKLWEISPAKDVFASLARFRELQRAGSVRYDDLPLETITGRRIEVEFVSNVYRVNGGKVIQCNVRNITERKLAEKRHREYSHKLEVLSRQLVEAQETERRNIARELHDEIGQALTVIELNLQAMMRSPAKAERRRLEECLSVVERVLAQVQDISLNLRPSLLDDLGLEPALRWTTDRQAALVGLEVQFHAERLGRRLDPVIETACFRIAQEALTNVVRHARAKVVTVNLQIRGDQLHLHVQDNGIGFAIAGVREKAVNGASLGLLGMEERAALVGGELQMTSAPGEGTEVHAWLPLKWRTDSEAGTP
jgi:PAS domain S-box-containing protein